MRPRGLKPGTSDYEAEVRSSVVFFLTVSHILVGTVTVLQCHL
jgi:hypothetical protein